MKSAPLPAAPPREPDLDALQQLMQAGDAAALDRLVRAYGPRLLAVARRHCRSPHDAEDAVQNALVSAGASMRSYRGDGTPLAWLSALVARGCYRLNRDPRNDPARTVRAHDDVGGGGGGDRARPCSCEDPEAVAERRELGDELGAALMTLSRLDRVTFLLAAEGWTSDEIAAHFQLTSNAVRSRIKRARKQLRDHVTQHASLAALPRASTTTTREAHDDEREHHDAHRRHV